MFTDPADCEDPVEADILQHYADYSYYHGSGDGSTPDASRDLPPLADDFATLRSGEDWCTFQPCRHNLGGSPRAALSASAQGLLSGDSVVVLLRHNEFSTTRAMAPFPVAIGDAVVVERPWKRLLSGDGRRGAARMRKQLDWGIVERMMPASEISACAAAGTLPRWCTASPSQPSLLLHPLAQVTSRCRSRRLLQIKITEVQMLGDMQGYIHTLLPSDPLSLIRIVSVHLQYDERLAHVFFTGPRMVVFKTLLPIFQRLCRNTPVWMQQLM
jgi:hypothetical protein